MLLDGVWRKSSGSGADGCVQVRKVGAMLNLNEGPLDEQWRKATRSNNNGACAQVRKIDDVIQVRDSKLGEASPILGFNEVEWAAFLDGARKGEFDTA